MIDFSVSQLAVSPANWLFSNLRQENNLCRRKSSRRFLTKNGEGYASAVSCFSTVFHLSNHFPRV